MPADLAFFYERSAPDAFVPSRATESPWSRELQHGGPPTALLARILEQNHPRPEMRIAKIAMDFLGPIPLRELKLRTRVVRPGRRIELLEGVLESGDREVATARVWRIATQPEGTVPAGVTLEQPPPPLPEARPQQYFPGMNDWGYGHATEWRFSSSAFGALGPAAVWTCVRLPLIAGEPGRDLDRLLIVADSGNGISAELPLGQWLFVPTAISIELRRYPRGEWVFMESATSLESDGVGLTSSRFADRDSYIGVGSQPLYIEALSRR